MGNTFGNLGRYDDARKYLHRSIDLSQQFRNKETKGLAHDYLGQLDYFQGYLMLAKEHMESAIRCLHEIGNKTRLAQSTLFKTIIFCELKNSNHWHALLQELEDLIEHSGSERVRCGLYIVKSGCLLKIGQYIQALKIAIEGVELAQRIGEGIQIPFLLDNAAIAALRAGKCDDALQFAIKGEAESEKVGHPLGQARIRIALAKVLLSSDKVDAAIIPAQEALVFCRQLDLGQTLQRALQINSEILAGQFQRNEKKIDDMMQQASDLVKRSESPWYRSDYLMTSIRIHLKRTMFEIAHESLMEARQLYEKLGLKNGTPELQSLEEAVQERKSIDRI
jgi:tetratricopeptide (TPR) repeat protein